MPPKGKHKNANQHEKRHDTGLAPPGKRISKDKSAPLTNGYANGKAVNSTPPPPLPSTGLNQGLIFPRPAPSIGEPGPAQISDVQIKTTGDGNKDQVLADAAEEEEVIRDMAGPTAADRSGSETRCPGENGTLKSLTSHASGSLALAVTILTSCPLRDAIAILILLLSLPPTLIITVHSLFASLTFVPPAAGLAWSSWGAFPALGDWFHSTPGGGPSPFTILFSDILMTVFYLPLPLPIQSILLDLGQSVIAISLSGASPGKGRSSNSVASCSAIILVMHLLRYRAVHLTGMDYVRSLLHNIGVSIPGESLKSTGSMAQPYVTHGWARILLGCHILAQGILTLLRRSLAGASRPETNKKQDPEAATNSDANKSLSTSFEANPETLATSSTDGRPPGPSPAARDSKEKGSTSKKKRKQANEVRSRQPLWAAIASTKVTVYKEMEQKQASTDALESAEEDTALVGLTPVLPQDDRIWIADIRSMEVTFRTDIPASPSKDEEGDTSSITLSGTSRPKPFHVRLNGADWGSTRILGATEERETDNKDKRVWIGEIYGLTPLTKYSCEFIRLSDQKVVCSTSLITLPAPSTEQATIVSAPPQHQSLRPLSPTSTLKQSIAAAEVKREDVRNKLKRSRKDHKNAASAIRREIDQLNSKVASSGGQDERQKQRILQLKQHIKQAEDATIALKSELDGIGEIPEDELEDAAIKRQAWEAACEARAVASAEMEEAKSEANKEMSQLHAELASAAQKRERLMTRRTKLSEQLERLVSEQNANLSARERYEQERARIRDERAKNEEQLIYWINQSRSSAENLNIKANEYFQEADLMNNQYQRRQASISGPPTPEGNLPGTNGPQASLGQGFEFQTFNYPQNQGILGPTRSGRGRSSSMLSGYSGFTDDLDVGGLNGTDGRKRSDGSSISAGSYGDHMSPRPIMKTMSPGPIRPPSTDDRRTKTPMSPIGGNR